MITRRSLLSSTGLVVAGLPFLNAQTIGAPKLPLAHDSVYQPLIKHLSKMYRAGTHVTPSQLARLSGMLETVKGVWTDNGTLALLEKQYHPATFEWTPDIRDKLLVYARKIEPTFQDVSLSAMDDLEEYRQKLPATVSATLSHMVSSMANSSIALATSREQLVKRVYFLNDPCGWVAWAIASGVIAGVTLLVPGAEWLSGVFTTVSAVYLAMDYLNVPCGLQEAPSCYTTGGCSGSDGADGSNGGDGDDGSES